MSEPDSLRNSRWTFSLGTMLMVVTIICLIVALLLTKDRLAKTEVELKSLRPLPMNEVATQFEKRTTLGPIITTVTDVRYSTDEDTYKVRFSWKNIDTNETWSSDVHLESDGYGIYFGTIRSEEFTKPLGHKNGYIVGVESPSTLQR